MCESVLARIPFGATYRDKYLLFSFSRISAADTDLKLQTTGHDNVLRSPYFITLQPL
jgi:hypothetical protein